MLRHHVGHRGMAMFYLAATFVLIIFGWRLQHIVYDPPPPAGQMYAAVFVRDPAAHVGLSARRSIRTNPGRTASLLP